MAGGTEFSEEIKQTELGKEVAQELKEINDAALRPTEKIETGMEHKDAEDLEKAFIESVPLAQAPERTPADKAAEGTVAPPETLTATQEDLDQGRSAENQNEGDLLATAEVQSVAAEVNIAAPVVTLEGAGADGKVTITEAAEPVAIIDTNDREVEVVETAADGGPKTEDRVEVAADKSVMIDTVPLPETPTATAEAGSRDSLVSALGGDVEDVYLLSQLADQQMHDPDLVGETEDDGEDPIGQDELKAGEYDIQFEIQGDKTEMGGYSRIEGSETLVSFGDPEAADGPDQAAGVEAGVIATAEADVSTAKTIGTEASQGSGIPIDEGGDTADGASPGGLEVGSVETAEQDIPETGEPTPVDEASSRSDIEEPTGTTEAEGSATLTNPSAVQTTHNITSVESGEQTISETGEPTSDTTEALENYSDQLSQFEKELELQQEDLLDLINDLKAEQLELTELQEQYDNTLANEPQPPSQEEFTDSNGGVDQNRKEELLDRYTESMKVYTNTLNILSAQITIKHDLITNIDGQITDKQAEIDKTQKDINKLLEIISNIQKPNNEDGDGDTSVHGPQDSIIQNIK